MEQEMANAPIANAPIANAPIANAPIANAPIANAPVAQQQETVTVRCCKRLFSAIFMLQLALVAILAIFLTIRGLKFTHSEYFDPRKWYTPLLTSVAVSGVASLAWQCFFVLNITATLRTTLWLTPILTFAVGLLLILSGTTLIVAGIGVVIFLFAIVLSLYGLYSDISRPYTNRMMLLSAGSPPPRTREIVVVSVILSVLYSAFLVTGIGGATATRTGLDIIFISIMMLSLAWTMQILKIVQQVAISKNRYVHFTSGEEVDVWNAFCNTLETKFGSVCVGSTLVPLIVFIRGAIRSYNWSSSSIDDVMYNSTDCFSSIANNVITYGNRWGFVQVGVHDKGFVQASSDTWKSFRRTAGLEHLIDSDITSSLCFLSATAVGAISALVAGIWTYVIHKDYLLELTLYAFIIGYFMGRVAIAWLQACVMGYYVAYAEDPQSNSFDDTIPQRIQRLQWQTERYYEIPDPPMESDTEL